MVVHCGNEIVEEYEFVITLERFLLPHCLTSQILLHFISHELSSLIVRLKTPISECIEAIL